MIRTGSLAIAGGRKVTGVQLHDAPPGELWVAVFGTPDSGPEYTGPVTFVRLPEGYDGWKLDK